MNTTRPLRTATGYIWRLPSCAATYTVGVMAGGAWVSALGMPLPKAPEQADQILMGLCLFLGSLAVAGALVPLARRIQGSYWVRWPIVALFCYVCLAATSALEGAIFTTLGGMGTIPLLSLPPCLLFAAVLTLLFKPVDRGEPFLANVRRFFHGRSAGRWAWRFALALCAFPVIYWTFGLMVAPFVFEYYMQGQFALATPKPAAILTVQFVRSGLFLLAAVPILMTWAGSKRQLILSLGIAFYVLVGLFGMLQSYWLAPTLQILHNLEMFADSMVYALALVLLLVHGSEASAEEQSARFLLGSEQATVEK